MQVKLQQSGYRIVDDAPLSIQMSGHGMYAIEQQVCAANGVDVWWKQVYPESGTCDINYERVLDKFNELVNGR